MQEFKNKKNIIITVFMNFVFVYVMIYTIHHIVNSAYCMDDIWVFQLSNLSKKGLLPYKGYNTIVSPFFILLLYGLMLPFNSLTGLKIISITIFILFSIGIAFNIFFKSYKIRHIDKVIILILLFNALIIEYNFFVFLIAFAIYLFVYNKQHPSYKELTLISLLSFFCIGIKITYGLMTCFAWFVCLLYYKENRKKNILTFISIGVLLCFFSYITMDKIGILHDFVDQCLKPITSHANAGTSDFYTLAGAVLFFIVLFIINIAFLFTFVKNYFKHDQESVTPDIILSYMMFGFSIINTVPTFNQYHMSFVTLWLFFFYISCRRAKCIKELKHLKNMFIFNTVFFLSLFILSVKDEISTQQMNINEYVTNCNTQEQYLVKDGDMINAINDYIDYHGNIRYLVISGYSEGINYFRNDSYNKYFDLMIDGNMGTVDPISLISEYSTTYDYVMFPIINDSSINYYDYLLDQRLKNYFKEKEPAEYIYINKNISYGIYNL